MRVGGWVVGWLQQGKCCANGGWCYGLTLYLRDIFDAAFGLAWLGVSGEISVVGMVFAVLGEGAFLEDLRLAI